MDEKKIYMLCDKYLNAGNLKIGFLLVPPIAYTMLQLARGQPVKWDTFIEFKILFSFIAIIIAELSADRLAISIKKKYEDATKLTENYDKLVKKYPRAKLIRYENCIFPGEQLAFRGLGSAPFQFKFDDRKAAESYHLPEQIRNHSERLMSAHNFSTIYNNTNVRLDKCVQDNDTVTLSYSRTTYFDSLVTNRAMDFPIEGKKTIREIYEPGPFLSPLSESRFSNHLGFNGFVEIAGGKLIFIYRSSDVSMGKKVWSPSINASYKTKYGLDDNRLLSAKYMGNAIRQEIKDELSIDIDPNIQLEDTIFAFYTDIVQGGKPHFLFYLRLPDLKAEEFDKSFRKGNTETENSKNVKADDDRKKQQKVKRDGTVYKFFTIDELRRCTISANGMTTSDNQTYPMQPFGTITLALFLKHISNPESITKNLLMKWLGESIEKSVHTVSDAASGLADAVLETMLGERTARDSAGPRSLKSADVENWKNCAEDTLREILQKNPLSGPASAPPAS